MPVFTTAGDAMKVEQRRARKRDRQDSPTHIIGALTTTELAVVPTTMVNEVILDQLARPGAHVLTADGADLTIADDDPTRTLIRRELSAVPVP